MVDTEDWADIDRIRSQSIFPLPPPTSEDLFQPEQLVSPSISPPKKKGGIFPCLCQSPGNEDASYEENPEPVVSADLSVSQLCPKLSSFSQRIEVCRVKGGISLDLLFEESDLFENFSKWMEEERASENIQCWIAFGQAIRCAEANTWDTCFEQIVDLNNTFFTSASPSQIGCCELYAPMRNLMEIVQGQPDDHDAILQLLILLKQNIEIIGLRDGLSRWQMFQFDI